MKLVAVGAAARQIWTEILPTDPGALISQTPAWLDCVCASRRYEDATRAYEADDGRRVVLPLARVRGIPRPVSMAASMPFGWSTGGLVCQGGRASAADVSAVIADLRAQRALRIAVRPSPDAGGLWAAAAPGDVARTHHMTQTLDLRGGFEVVQASRFSRGVNAKCRKAERKEITPESDDSGQLISVFDALYRTSVERWARQQHEPLVLARWRAERRDPRRKFDSVARRLGSACRVWVARRGGEPAAAIIVLTHGAHSTYWRGAMDRDLVGGTGANELLHRLAIEDACVSGRRFYHMGESAPSSSLARFKRGFGAEEQHYEGYRFERLPLTAADALARRQTKRVLRFRD